MATTARKPAFLSQTGPAPEVRPVQFGLPRAAVPPPAPEPPPPPPPAPDAAELEAIRAEAMQRVAHAVEVLRLQSARLAEQARSDALEVGFQVARRVLEAEVKADPSAVIALVRSALRRAGDARKVSVRVHPDDLASVEAAAGAGDLPAGVARVEVAADAALSRGDVLVDTDFGRVDGRLRTRLDELHRAAFAAVGEGVA